MTEPRKPWITVRTADGGTDKIEFHHDCDIALMPGGEIRVEEHDGNTVFNPTVWVSVFVPKAERPKNADLIIPKIVPPNNYNG